MSPRAALKSMVLLLLLSGCNRAASLDGAVGKIPVYKPTTLEDFFSAHTGVDMGNPTQFSSYSWELRSPHGWEKVDAWYQKYLPNAEREDIKTADDNGNEPSIMYRDVPPGSAAGEMVRVVIYKAPVDGKTKLRITEEVLSPRRKR